MVPVDNAREVGLRVPIGGADCQRLLELLAAPFEAPPAHWKGRQRESLEKTRTGDIFALADVLKKLTFLDSRKPLPYAEKRRLERARLLVIGELAHACRKTEVEAESAVIVRSRRHTQGLLRRRGVTPGRARPAVLGCDQRAPTLRAQGGRPGRCGDLGPGNTGRCAVAGARELYTM
jgi:RNA polymerase-interacting CarD/CdnL/TRCF family regulator